MRRAEHPGDPFLETSQRVSHRLHGSTFRNL
jgi:hypothetical protein